MRDAIKAEAVGLNHIILIIRAKPAPAVERSREETRGDSSSGSCLWPGPIFTKSENERVSFLRMVGTKEMLSRSDSPVTFGRLGKKFSARPDALADYGGLFEGEPGGCCASSPTNSTTAAHSREVRMSALYPTPFG